MPLKATFPLLVVVSLIGFGALARSDKVDLPQGDRISADVLEKLQAAHGVALNQKAQEVLFLSLPLIDPKHTDSVTVANSTATVASPHRIRRRMDKSNATLSIDNVKRQVPCVFPLTYEGQDPCTGAEKEPGFVPCRQPCTFTLNWFIANTRQAPANGECLFYTSGLSVRAQAFAAQHNGGNPQQRLSTIWEIWPEWLYDGSTDIGNPMRCIIQDDIFLGRRNAIRQTFFEIMSDSMAYMCGGGAAVMDRNIRKGRTGRVKQAGIWQRVEFARLKMDGAHKWTDPRGLNRVCNTIDAVGENDLSVPDTVVWWRNWWYRGGPDWPNEDTSPLKRRDTNVTDELDLGKRSPLNKRTIDSSIFDEGGRFAIDW